jgi:DNA topoisomerase-6 subunit B
VFLRRRERARSEFRRRNIFELYIEEVVEACGRLKGGKLAGEKLRSQLQKIAAKRTGGTRTDEILGHEDGDPDGLPYSIIVTPEGSEGEAPALPAGGPEGKTSELSPGDRNDGPLNAEPRPEADELPARAGRKAKLAPSRRHAGAGRPRSARATDIRKHAATRSRKATVSPKRKKR